MKSVTSLWQFRLTLAAALYLTLTAGPAFAQDGTSRAEPVDSDRFRTFLDTVVLSPLFYVEVAGSGVLDQIGGFPEEWTGGGGFGHRNAARLEQLLVAEAIGQGAAAAMHHEVRYDPCACQGAFPRVRHAVGRIFIGRHEDGHNVLNVPRLMSAYGSAAVADFFYPASYTRRDVFMQATTGLGLAAGVNILKEFVFR